MSNRERQSRPRETNIFRGKARDVDRYNQQNDAYTW